MMLRKAFLVGLVLVVPSAYGQETTGHHVAQACNLMRGVAYSPGHALQVAAGNNVTRENYHQRFLQSLPWNAFTTNIAVGLPNYQDKYARREDGQGTLTMDIANAIRQEVRNLKFPAEPINEFEDLAGRLRDVRPEESDDRYLPERFQAPRLYSLLVVEVVLASVSGTAEDDQRQLEDALSDRLDSLPKQVAQAQLRGGRLPGNYSLVQFLSNPSEARVQASRHGFLSSWFGYSDIPGNTRTYRWMSLGTYDFQCTHIRNVSGSRNSVAIQKGFETVDFGSLR